MPIRILIADDHDVVREGVKTILKARPEWDICSETSNGKDAVEEVRHLRPDVAILDITMPGLTGLEAAREIRKMGSATRVLMLTMHDTNSVIKAAKEVGARGLVFKSLASRDLIPALEAVLADGTYFGPYDLSPAKSPPSPGAGPKFLLKSESRQPRWALAPWAK